MLVSSVRSAGPPALFYEVYVAFDERLILGLGLCLFQRLGQRFLSAVRSEVRPAIFFMGFLKGLISEYASAQI